VTPSGAGSIDREDCVAPAPGRSRRHMKLLLSFSPVRLLACLLAVAFIAGPVATLAGEEKPEDKCPHGESKTTQGCAKYPKLKHKVEPVYPPEARKRHVDGTVTVQAVVTVEGTVKEIKVLDVKATDEDYKKDFAKAAVAAVAQWRYDPGTHKGKPVPVQFTSVIQFKSGG
jgi:TonB family protein